MCAPQATGCAVEREGTAEEGGSPLKEVGGQRAERVAWWERAEDGEQEEEEVRRQRNEEEGTSFLVVVGPTLDEEERKS